MADPIVIDASAMVELVLPGQLLWRVESAVRGHDLVAPDHIIAEVMGALARFVRADLITLHQATNAVANLEAFPLKTYPLQSLVPGTWQLLPNVQVADAFYIALAAKLSCPLVTLDRGQMANYSPTTWIRND